MNEEKMKNCDKINIISGELKEANDNFENFKDFIKRWEAKIKEIKILFLDNPQAYHIAQDFIDEISKFMYKDYVENKNVLLDQLVHDLLLALFQANNNYRKEFPSFWQNFHKLKLPELHFHK